MSQLLNEILLEKGWRNIIYTIHTTHLCNDLSKWVTKCCNNNLSHLDCVHFLIDAHRLGDTRHSLRSDKEWGKRRKGTGFFGSGPTKGNIQDRMLRTLVLWQRENEEERYNRGTVYLDGRVIYNIPRYYADYIKEKKLRKKREETPEELVEIRETLKDIKSVIKNKGKNRNSNSLVRNSKKLKKEVKGNSTKDTVVTVAKKLEKLKELYQKKLITKDVYEEQQKEVLDGF